MPRTKTYFKSLNINRLLNNSGFLKRECKAIFRRNQRNSATISTHRYLKGKKITEKAD